MTTRHAPGNPYVEDPDELLSDSVWEDQQQSQPVNDGDNPVG
jgi:hypothetical protein